MKDNDNNTNHPDSDVLLPPRKRLLAGLKRQSSESPSQSSLENSVSHFPLPLPMEFDSRLQNLLKSHKNGHQMSSKEIAKAAKRASAAAAKAARAARAAAEEKAVIAANAVAAAKNALSLVADCSMETGRLSRKNKMKKQVPVENLYKEQRALQNNGADEELARKLHMANSTFPSFSKDSPKNKHKRAKHTLQYENHGLLNGMKLDLMKEGNKCDDKAASRSNRSEQVEEVGFKTTDGSKSGRVQDNKLHLSLCSFEDRTNPKDGVCQTSSDGGHKSASPMERSADKRVPIEDAMAWKCQDYNVPQCIKSNKVVQS